MNIKIRHVLCGSCGYRWVPRKPKIRQCPKCRSMISGNGKGAKDMNADSLLMKPRQITYGYTDYGFFSVEKVYINGESNGEYHIKLSDDSSHQHAVLFFSMHLKGCEVGMIDPILSVEYPIYVRSKEKDIDSLFTELNKLIEEFRRKAE